MIKHDEECMKCDMELLFANLRSIKKYYMNKHNQSLLWGVIIAVVLIGGAYLLFSNSNSSSPSSAPAQSAVSIPTSQTCITSQEAYSEIGQNTCVEYYVGYATESSNSNVFLDENTDYTNGFSVTIFSDSLSKFSDPVGTYNGKTIDVSGTIKRYQGHPEIIVTDPSQITIK